MPANPSPAPEVLTKLAEVWRLDSPYDAASDNGIQGLIDARIRLAEIAREALTALAAAWQENTALRELLADLWDVCSLDGLNPDSRAGLGRRVTAALVSPPARPEEGTP